MGLALALELVVLELVPKSALFLGLVLDGGVGVGAGAGCGAGAGAF